MSDLVDEEVDYASAYEALVEFLYLAPVGIIKFRPDGTIDMANPTAAQLLMPLTPDGDMSDLYRLLSGLAPDLRAHVERFQEPAGQIFDQMQLVVPNTPTTLMLDINKINDSTMMAALQNITDLTDARRKVLRATESQRMLASVFMRINTPVVVIRADGFILITNSAFQRLLGYDSTGLVGLNIDALLPPEYTATARAARAQQKLDGSSYEVEMDLVAKDGTRSHAIMHSSILSGSDLKQLRVITLVSPTAKLDSTSDVHSLLRPATSLGSSGTGAQVKTIDLSRIRLAVGADWQFMGSRAMKLIEEAVRPLLNNADILKQGKNDSFVIWFADGDYARNAAIVARATQVARRVFMTEFGTKVADRVSAAVIA